MDKMKHSILGEEKKRKYEQFINCLVKREKNGTCNWLRKLDGSLLSFNRWLSHCVNENSLNLWSIVWFGLMHVVVNIDHLCVSKWAGDQEGPVQRKCNCFIGESCDTTASSSQTYWEFTWSKRYHTKRHAINQSSKSNFESHPANEPTWLAEKALTCTDCTTIYACSHL